MYNISARSVYKSLAFLFFTLIFLHGNVSFAQENNFSEKGLLRKQQAISKLGTRLPAVAAKHGKTASELRRLFLQDETLHVDKNDKLLYIDKAPDAAEAAAASALAAPAAAPYPYSQTFALHSRPGSNRVIYLDFNGHSVTSTNFWNNYNGGNTVSAPFNIDSDPNSFSALEQDAIQNIWQRIAEDYAPFDVDVTTEDMGDAAIIRDFGADPRYGTRAVMTTTNFMGPGIGGVAFLGVYNYIGGEDYQPAYIFTAGFNSSKGIAEAASHEIGHNLGLDHDGTATQGYYAGHGAWAPIMGVGYSYSISQWSKGEYPGASNQQDDLQIIQNHGLNLIADDYGNTTGTAGVMSGTNISATGLITARTDVDVFRFTAGSGNANINIKPAPFGGNLDIKAQILDSAGNVIATSDPSSYSLLTTFPAGISAGFNQFLSAGTYYLTIDGAGNAADDPSAGYSDYGSIGQYTISGTLSGAGGGSQSPIAVASANLLSGTTPLTVYFYSTNSYDPDGQIQSHFWNFGDGSTSSTPNPSHVYNSAGTFIATLTVTDNSGLTGTSSLTINAANPVSTSSIAGYVTYGITPVGQSTKSVPGVLMSTSGASIVSTTTGVDGSYLLGNLISGGQYTITPAKTGNANGITPFDVALVLRHIAAGGTGANALSGNQLIAADTNGSGTITPFDATQILRYIAANGSNTGTGTTGQWRLSPAPRSYNAITNSVTNQNFEAILIGEVNGSWSATAGIVSGDESVEQKALVMQKSDTNGIYAENSVLPQ
jgi:PKD repeat protein